MTDLFITTKKDQIYHYIKSKGRVPTHEIIAYGLSIFTNRADRYARDLAEEGKIWRVQEQVKASIREFAKSREEVWSVYESDRDFSRKEQSKCPNIIR